MTVAEKAKQPHSICSGEGCVAIGVVGKQHKAVTGGKVVKCGRYQASE